MTETALRVRAAGNTRRLSRVRGGFTIIELAVVLTLVGIIAGTAMPRLNYQRYRADAAARVTRATLQTSQRQAIMRQTNVLIAFSIAGRRMIVIEDANNNYTYDVGERMRVRPLEEGAQFVLPTVQVPGTATSTSAVSGPNLVTVMGLPALAFLRDGASSSDANIYICSARCLPENQRALILTQSSGRTESWRYSGTMWRRSSL
jgi:prepilin-type N-terminal cleavage/methylation domain-containing protein